MAVLPCRTVPSATAASRTACPRREGRDVVLPPRDHVQVFQELCGLVVFFRLGEHGELLRLLPCLILEPCQLLQVALVGGGLLRRPSRPYSSGRSCNGFL